MPSNTQHATEIGHGTDNETDAGAAAAFQNADLYALHRRLRAGAGESMPPAWSGPHRRGGWSDA